MYAINFFYGSFLKFLKEIVVQFLNINLEIYTFRTYSDKNKITAALTTCSNIL